MSVSAINQSEPTPSSEFTEVVIVGSGFSGLCAAIKLKEAGIKEIIIIEKADDVGGTWRDNNYPGCACDVPSHLYSYSFEGNPNWSESYADWHEIQDYIKHCTQKYDLRPLIRFGQEIEEARFDELKGHWHIKTKQGKSLRSKFLIMGTGPLHKPQIPNIKGLDRFEGEVFHSAQWNHEFDLTGKKVASIGTGGSAIQYVPKIAPQVDELKVFQRTPPWVLPRNERPYRTWEKKLFTAMPMLRQLHRLWIYSKNEIRILPMRHPVLIKVAETVAKRFIRKSVSDPVVAKRMVPDYTIGCKRILISNTYYPTFNRDNVSLITDGISEVTHDSIVTRDGQSHKVDAIVLGTGFVVDPRIYMKGMTFTGRGGVSLLDLWKDGPECYYGMTVSGFPNMFQMTGPNTGLGHNSIVYMIECQVRYIVDGIKKVRDRGYKFIDLKPSVLRSFNDDLQERLKNTVWTSGCVSWYQQEDGKNIALWPGSTLSYRQQTHCLNIADYEVVVEKRQGAEPQPLSEEKVAYS